MIKSAIGYCAIILFGSLLAALIGGGFATLIAFVSPELVTGIFSLDPVSSSVPRYAFAVGIPLASFKINVFDGVAFTDLSQCSRIEMDTVGGL